MCLPESNKTVCKTTERDQCNGKMTTSLHFVLMTNASFGDTPLEGEMHLNMTHNNRSRN